MERHTALVAAASVAGVILTGAMAVGANTRILDSAAAGTVGELSAADPTTTAAPALIVQPIDPTTVPVEDNSSNSFAQLYLVEEAGSLVVTSDADTMALGEIVAADGWDWTVDQLDAQSMTVTFQSPAATYIFTADLAPDGTVAASVDQIIDEQIIVPAPVSSNQGHHGDDEGEHEYEGGDDDD